YLVQYFERSRMEYHPENAGTAYEVLLGQLGTEVVRKKGYPYGWYPRYGRAVDFSWIAGQWIPPRYMCLGCNCDTIHYVNNANYFDINASVQPYGPGWYDAPLKANYVVIFGQLKAHGSEAEPCFAPGYLVDKTQPNPTR